MAKGRPPKNPATKAQRIKQIREDKKLTTEQKKRIIEKIKEE